MDDGILTRKFARIGARLTMVGRPSRRTRWARFQIASRVALDVPTDRKGEFFEIAVTPGGNADPLRSPFRERKS